MRGKIGVWGHFHGGNIGDDVVVATLIANIRQRLPTHEIYGFSLKPEDTARRHGVPSGALHGGRIVAAATETDAESTATRATHENETSLSSATRPARRADPNPSVRSLAGAMLPGQLKSSLRTFKRLLRATVDAPSMLNQLRRFDAIFVAGSGPVFDDMGGPWVHPYNLFRWALLCRLAGTKFCLMNVGAGPIRQKLSRRFLSWALRLSHYHAFRDESSVELARTLGIRKPSPCVCDMAFAVPEDELETARATALTAPRPLAGIAPMAYMDSIYWPDADISIGERYLDALAELSVWLLDAGHDLVLLKSQRHADERTASGLLAKMRQRAPHLDESRINNPETLGHKDLLRYMTGSTVVVGGRFHCHVLPFVLGIPVLGVSYHPKTDELMRQMKQQKYFTSMDAVTGEALIRIFQELENDKVAVQEEIRRRSAENRELLRRQFDEVFSERFLVG